MPEHVWSVLCQKTSLDQHSGMVSIFGVVEALAVTGPEPKEKGLLPFEATLISMWRRSEASTPEAFQSRIVVITPDGAEHPAGEVFTADLQTNLRFRIFAPMTALPFRGGGVYRFAVDWRARSDGKWARVARVPLDVLFERVKPSARPMVELRPKQPKLLVPTRR